MKGTRADNLAYLLQRSKELTKGPAFMDHWHDWRPARRGRGRKRRRTDRCTIRKTIIDSHGAARIAARGTKKS